MSKTADIALICACCCGLQVFIAMTCFLLAVPIYLLVVGIVEMDSCAADSRIPVWMICTAALMIIERMMESVNQAMDRKFLNDNPKPDIEDGDIKIAEWEKLRSKNKSKALFGLISLSRLAIFVSTIVGSVFVFSAYSIRSQCNGLLYWSAFVYCIVTLSLSALGLTILGGMCLVLVILATKSK
ncbi:unnamed protein product [Caenorhabditis nigoni]